MFAAIASAAGNILGSHLRNKAAKAASARQMAFQRDMSDTSYQRGMEDMRKAGLNPILAGKVGGASTPTGSTYNPENVATNAVNSYMQYQQNQANVKQTEAQTAKIIAETKLLDSTQGSFMGRNVEFIKKEAGKVITNVKEKQEVQSALDKIIEFHRAAKSRVIKNRLKKSGSNMTYKGKPIYIDRIMRTK